MGILFRKASRLFLFFLLTFRVAGELQAQTPAQCGGYALRLREDPSRVGYFISELPLFLNAESITLAAWVRPTAEASDRNEMGIIYRKFYVASMQRGWVEYGLVINSKGEFMFRGLFAKTDGEAQSENTPTRLDSLTSGVVPEKGKWYHVAVTVDHLSKACTFYINGRLVANKTMDGPLRWRMAVGGNYDPMTIGATSISNGTFFSAANYFQGYLDDVLVSSKALTLAQILTIATSGPDKDFADEDFGLEVFYRFLEGSGTSTQSTPYVHSTVGYGFTAVARGLVAWIRFTCDNRPPIAHAGPNKTLVLPENRWTLDGSASSDPDGTIKSYSWQFLNGPTNPKIINSHTPKPEVSGLEEGVYAFQLTVTDDKGATGVAVVTITVENVLKVLLVNATQLVAPSPNPNGFLVSNFSKIDRDQQLQGVATDGVSRVVLLIETKKKIRFTIDEYDASKGSLAPFQDQQVRTSVQEGETQNGVTAVIYTAPDGYGDQYSLRGGRMVTITATEVENPSKKYKAQIRLMTPPI
ncbi:MAG TPA: LamG-like jellyroll fold domain-containing protein, partial [Chitinophagaceae bacterium]|nr:LamG-like jellyroll fold domain-containing protein [Chitinophagaceae bacterium]